MKDPMKDIDVKPHASCLIETNDGPRVWIDQTTRKRHEIYR